MAKIRLVGAVVAFALACVIMVACDDYNTADTTDTTGTGSEIATESDTASK